jgi:hypothetical protein
MSVDIYKAELRADVSKVLQAYFEMKAFSSICDRGLFYKRLGSEPVIFSGLIVAGEQIFAGARDIDELLKLVLHHIDDGDVAYGTFLALISCLESFMVSVLKENHASFSGTLGNLQSRMYNICCEKNSIELKLLDEIRERRNCFVHNHGFADAKYVSSYKDLIVPKIISDIKVNDRIVLSGEYFIFVAETIFLYSDLF